MMHPLRNYNTGLEVGLCMLGLRVVVGLRVEGLCSAVLLEGVDLVH